MRKRNERKGEVNWKGRNKTVFIVDMTLYILQKSESTKMGIKGLEFSKIAQYKHNAQHINCISIY